LGSAGHNMVASPAAWRRAAFERLEATPNPRRKTHAQATRREVERASAYFALHEAAIPGGLVAARRRPKVSAPTRAPVPRRERRKVPMLAVTPAARQIDNTTPPPEPPRTIWRPPTGATPRPPPDARRQPKSGAPCYLSVAPADAFLVALEFLDPDVTRVLQITTALSHDVTAWLAPAAEGLWRSLCSDDGCDVAPDGRSATPCKDAYRLAVDLRDRGLVVEIGMGGVRAGCATAATPHHIPLNFDALRSTLDVEICDTTTLPPPSVQRQALLLADPSVLRRLIKAASESVGLFSLKGVSVVLVRPPACERQGFARACALALDDARRYVVVDPLLNADVVLDVGLFRTTAATKRRTAHQRLAGAALTRFVQLSDGDPYASSAKAEALKFSGECPACVSILLEPMRGGDALEAALGEAPANLKGLVELAASVAPQRETTTVALTGASSMLPGLRQALARALPENWRLQPPEGAAATRAWRGVAARAAARDIAWADLDAPNFVR